MNDLTNLLLLSLWCHGWHHLFQPGEALYFLSRPAYEALEKGKRKKEHTQHLISEWRYSEMEKITNDVKDVTALNDLYNEKIEETNIKFERSIYFLKPLFLCSICFASIYGTGGYLLLTYTTWGIFPVSVIGLISVNKIMQKFVQ
jgi:hypothetical protein